MGDPISWTVWIGVLIVLYLTYCAIRGIIEGVAAVLRTFQRYEKYRNSHPYDWKRNGR